MTEFIFREDSYVRSLPTLVAAITPEGGIVLDRTIFYATSGGQPGDTGRLERADGSFINLAGTIHPDGDKTAIVHLAAEGQPPLAAGEEVIAHLDWERRHKLMRMHTALHLVTVVLPYPITGASVAEDKGRVDFNLPDAPDADEIESKLNDLVNAGHAVSAEWISDEELAANPGLIKSMNVKPPVGQGRVRLVRIGDIDLQPCGGTHVRNTSEIGPLRLGKIEKKGAINRRVSVLFG
ncbi:alanyl-tRNA editing protein [Devosia sp. ZB163]|uniref:alanyl-tRNA editing protein n=1 Tax=Devosia sp. ZB163 TaxID=3025938 RepID=UPI00235F4928|nr:alanyl-tRNA editing protein [Devosia sp. ZB163]MDC9824253.1 alanyl-tRNA editing protein [Devosia sp. ZB163]